MTPTANWRHISTNFNDQNYADTVYRTVTNTLDGKIKDQYLAQLRELHINPADIQDL